MLKLRRLKIDQYRNVRPCELRFNDGFNIVLGLNGTGKTTLLNLLSDFLVQVPSTVSGDDPLRLEVEYEWDQGGGIAQFQRPESEDWYMRERVPKRYSCVRFGEGIETLALLESSIWGYSINPSFRGVSELEGLAVGSLIEAINQRLVGEVELPAEIRLEHEDLAYLADVARLEGFRSIALRMEHLSKQVRGRGLEMHEYGRPRFYITRKDGSEHYHDRLSRGQKRLLSFLYYLEANPDIVIADELVNDLHHAWISHCVERIGSRQAFLTSQNPLLLDHLTFASPEEVERSFILCSIAEGSEGEDSPEGGVAEELIWRNPSPGEAEAFFRAYEAGVLQVSEILRSKGLW